MQQYPNYYQIPTNNFGQQYNPYLQRMENLQHFQQVLNQQPTQYPIGKVVENVDMVRVTDIPMDGNLYYFPKADGTEVYAKQFMQNGQTRILTFKAMLEDEPNTLTSATEKSDTDDFRGLLDGIMNEVKVLSQRLDDILATKAQGKTKKEAPEDVTDMVKDMSAEEKNMLRSKLQTLAQKIS